MVLLSNIKFFVVASLSGNVGDTEQLPILKREAHRDWGRDHRLGNNSCPCFSPPTKPPRRLNKPKSLLFCSSRYGLVFHIYKPCPHPLFNTNTTTTFAGAGMLGKSFTSTLLTFDCSARLHVSSLDIGSFAPTVALGKLNSSHCQEPTTQINEIRRRAWTLHCASKNWKLCSTAQGEDVTLENEGKMSWEACREALVAFNFSVEDVDKMLGKAFGHIYSPYWGEEKAKEAPRLEFVREILDFLRSLGLSDDDLSKLLKKFPEVLGCSLNEDLKNNVQILGDTWGIKGKSLRNLLLRNPKVLGYNIDCKGDCMAQCTRCWVRF